MAHSIRLLAAVGGLLCAVWPTRAAAGEPEFIGHAAGVAYTVSVDDARAAIGAGRRVFVLDIADPTAPSLLGMSDVLPRTVRSVHLEGGRLLAGLEERDVHVFDVSDPAAPAETAVFETGGEVRDMAADERFAYLAAFGDGVVVLDASDLSRPREAARDRSSRDINDVIADGQVVFATSATGGLNAFGVDDRGRLELLSTVRAVVGNGKANQMALEAGRMYVANGEGVVAVDVSDPARPQPLGAFVTNGSAWDIAARGDRVYVADGQDGVLVADVSDPLLPAPLGTMQIPFEALRLTVQDDMLYVVDWVTGLHLIDISSDPSAVGVFGDLGFVRSIARVGDMLAIGLARNALATYDPTTLSLLDKETLPASAQELTVRAAGDVVYVGDVRAGLWAFDARQPADLKLLDHMPMDVRDLEVDDRFAYITTGLDGFQTASIEDPTTLLGLQKMDSAHFSWGISMAGSLAYIADREGGIQIVDVSSPAVLNEAARIPGQGRTRDVEVRGNLAYVADADNGLLVYDVSMPAQAQLIGRHQAPALEGDTEISPFLHPQRIVLSSGGRYAIVANTEAKVSIVDISRPDRPRLDHTLDVSWPVTDFAVHEDLLYVAAGGEGLLVYRMDDGVGDGIAAGANASFAPSRRGLGGIGGLLPLVASFLLIAAAVAGMIVLRRGSAVAADQSPSLDSRPVAPEAAEPES